MLSNFRNPREFYFDYVCQLDELYTTIENEGVLCDQIARRRLWYKYSDKATNLQAELDSIAGRHINVNSWQQVAQFVYSDLGYPQRKGTGEDVLVVLLANHGKTEEKRRGLDLVLDLRKVKKTISTYIEARPDYDGRYRTNYRICGAETGRPSTSILEPPVRPHDIGMAFTTMTKHGDIGADIREMFIADEGCIIGEADKSQAEARIVAHLANDEVLMDKINNSDVHIWTASLCFGVPEEHIDKENPMRFVGKTGRHLAHYGGGKKRLLLTIMVDSRKFHIDIDINEAKAGMVLNKIHQYSPKIRGEFHRGIEEYLLANDRVLVNPFGRRRQFFDRWGPDLLGEAYNQIPQSTVTDELRHAMLRLKKRLPKLRIWLDAYDAFAWQSKIEDFENDCKIIKEEMEIPTDYERCSLSRGPLTIPCEIKYGINYKDLKKYKGGLDL